MVAIITRRLFYCGYMERVVMYRTAALTAVTGTTIRSNRESKCFPSCCCVGYFCMFLANGWDNKICRRPRHGLNWLSLIHKMKCYIKVKLFKFTIMLIVIWIFIILFIISFYILIIYVRIIEIINFHGVAHLWVEDKK